MWLLTLILSLVGLKKMKKVAIDVVSKRKNEKDKKCKIFLDTLLENEDVFPTDDEVCSNILAWLQLQSIKLFDRY